MEAASPKRKKGLPGIALLALCLTGWISFKYVRSMITLAYIDSAIVRIRSVMSAQVEFARANPQVGYACALSQLPGDDELWRGLKRGEVNGYAFQITGCEAPGVGKPHWMYQIIARPMHRGLPAYCADQSGVLKQAQGSRAEECLISGVPLGS